MKRAATGLFIAAAVAALSAGASTTGRAEDRDTRVAVPQSVRVEHQDLLAELAAATREAGELGEAARALEAILRPHFAKEEAFALPPLGWLPRLAEGRVTSGAVEVVAMSDLLRAERSRLFDDHVAITAAINELNDVAARQGAPDYARLAERLALHAAYEIEVLYPASIVVGEYVKASLGQ